MFIASPMRYETNETNVNIKNILFPRIKWCLGRYFREGSRLIICLHFRQKYINEPNVKIKNILFLRIQWYLGRLFLEGSRLIICLHFRRKYIYEPNVNIKNPVEINLLYVQARDGILDGTHPCTLDESTKVCNWFAK